MGQTWFRVNVPVLSLQIVVAEPIVSQADSLRTCTQAKILKNDVGKLTKDKRETGEKQKTNKDTCQRLIRHHFPHRVCQPVVNWSPNAKDEKINEKNTDIKNYPPVLLQPEKKVVAATYVKVTAKGSPSGTATTTMVTWMVLKLSK